VKCTGECCEVFFLPLSSQKELDELTNKVEQHELLQKLFRHDEGNNFTCTAWDPKTKKCTVYDSRPNLCARYPYGRECAYCGAKTDEESVS